MPELCEVQIMTENLERWLTDRTITSIEILDAKFPKMDFSDWQVRRVYRRAKYSLIEFSTHTMVLHYRMTGQVLLETPETRFTRLRIHLENASTIAFVDPRRFGTLEFVENSKLPNCIESKGLGAEIWPMKRDGLWWKSQFFGVGAPLKAALLRQDKVVGIGNILASEFCFAARLSPFANIRDLQDVEWQRLADAARQRIDAILEEERSDKIGFLHEGSKNPTAFQVYGRAGEPCPRCSYLIQKRTQAIRTTYFCISCQNVG